MRPSSAGLLLLGTLLVAAQLGCAGHEARVNTALRALDQGQPKAAIAALNEELEVKSAEELPADLEGDNALLVLDRATILQSMDRHTLSARDFGAADKAIDLLDLSAGAADDIGRYLFSDSVGRYRAPGFEKLLINTFNLMNYLALGDLSGARVEARRLAVMQKYLADHEDGTALIGLGSYLAGFAFEHSGQRDEALGHYDDALAYASYPSLREPLRRLTGGKPSTERIDALTGARPRAARPAPGGAPAKAPPKPRPEQQPPPRPADGDVYEDDSDGSAAEPAVEPPQAAPAGKPAPAPQSKPAPAPAPAPAAQPQDGELLIVVGYGRIPQKLPTRIPIGVALTLVAHSLSPHDHARANALAAKGLVTWINFPRLGKSRGRYSVPQLWLDSRPVSLEHALDIEAEVRDEWERNKGTLILAAITRLLVRAAAGEIAQATTDATTQEKSGVVGLLAGLATTAALTAADTPDTRSWSTLPANVAIARLRLPPGRHDVVISARGQTGRYQVMLNPGGWAFVTMTALR